MFASWQFWALVAAFFASLTAIFAKIGVTGINSDFATFIRTIVIIVILALFLSVSGQWQSLAHINQRTWMFLILSGFATGASWLAYFRALQLGNASLVAPVDKLSVVLVAVFSVLFLGEKLALNQWLGVFFVSLGAILLCIKL